MKPTASEGPEGEAFKLEEFLPDQLALAASGVSRLMARRYAEEAGLTIPEWRVIVVVGQFGAISPTRVSEQTGMDKVKVSRAAASLVARGLLRQSPDPVDGRARVLSMTRKGQRMYQDVVPLARHVEDEITSVLNRSERSVLQRALGKLHAHMDRLAGPEGAAEAE